MFFQPHQAATAVDESTTTVDPADTFRQNPRPSQKVDISEKELDELRKIKHILQSQAADLKKGKKKHFHVDDENHVHHRSGNHHRHQTDGSLNNVPIVQHNNNNNNNNNNRQNSRDELPWMRQTTNFSHPSSHRQGQPPNQQQWYPLTKADVIAIGFFLGLFGVIAIIALIMALQEKSTIATALNLGYKIIRDKQNPSNDNSSGVDSVKETKKEQHLTAFQKLKNQAIDQLGGIANEFVARHFLK